MTTLREAAQQALEALDRMYTPKHPSADDFQAALDAITSIRTALAEPERKPLTDEEIGKIILETEITLKNYCDVDLQTDFARRIERAHGIGGEA